MGVLEFNSGIFMGNIHYIMNNIENKKQIEDSLSHLNRCIILRLFTEVKTDKYNTRMLPLNLVNNNFVFQQKI